MHLEQMVAESLMKKPTQDRISTTSTLHERRPSALPLCRLSNIATSKSFLINLEFRGKEGDIPAPVLSTPFNLRKADFDRRSFRRAPFAIEGLHEDTNITLKVGASRSTSTALPVGQRLPEESAICRRPTMSGCSRLLCLTFSLAKKSSSQISKNAREEEHAILSLLHVFCGLAATAFSISLDLEGAFLLKQLSCFSPGLKRKP